MKYKLKNNSSNNINNIVQTIFENRGINNYKEYMNLDDNVLIPYNQLDNIDKAVECLLKHLENKNKILIVVD